MENTEVLGSVMKNRIEKTLPVAVIAMGLAGLAACSDYDDDNLQASAYSEETAKAMEERMDVIERRLDDIEGRLDTTGADGMTERRVDAYEDAADRLEDETDELVDDVD